MMWPIVQLHSTSKTILNCHDRLDLVQPVTKIRQDNDVIDRTDAVYAENEIELLWSIGPGPVFDEN